MHRFREAACSGGCCSRTLSECQPQRGIAWRVKEGDVVASLAAYDASIPRSGVVARLCQPQRRNYRPPERRISRQTCLASHVAKTRSACVSVVALVGPNRSSSRGSQDSVDSAVIIAGASEPTL